MPLCRESGLDEVCHKLCVCNAVRDALEGEILSVRFQQLLLKPSKRMVDFILEVLAFLCHDLCRSCKCLGHRKGLIHKSTNLGTPEFWKLLHSLFCRFAHFLWKRSVHLRHPEKTWPFSWSEFVSQIRNVEEVTHTDVLAYFIFKYQDH